MIHTGTDTAHYRVGERVRLRIAAQTDLGFKAIINERDQGVLYANEVFQPIRLGQQVDGYSKKIRDDGKIDLTLQQAGHDDREAIGEKILQLLKQAGGSLPVTDKSSAETIYKVFGVSKKKYKAAVGGLYKKRLIRLGESGIESSRS